MKSFVATTMLSMTLVARVAVWWQPVPVQVQATIPRYYPVQRFAAPIQQYAEPAERVIKVEKPAVAEKPVESSAPEGSKAAASPLAREALQAVKSRVSVVIYGYDGCGPCLRLHKRLEDELAPRGWDVGRGEIKYVTIAKPRPGRVYPRVVCFVDDEPVEEIAAAGNATSLDVTSLYLRHFNAIDDRPNAKAKLSSDGKLSGMVARGVCSCGLACDCVDCQCHTRQQVSTATASADSYTTYLYTVRHAGRRVFGGWR